MTLVDAIVELDTLVERLDDSNLRGFMRRVPTSRHYRPPCVGAPADVPTERQIRFSLVAARIEDVRRASRGGK